MHEAIKKACRFWGILLKKHHKKSVCEGVFSYVISDPISNDYKVAIIDALCLMMWAVRQHHFGASKSTL